MLSKLTTQMVRAWRAELLGCGVSGTMAAKAYRLLRAILMTAVDEDRILAANPCRVKGAGSEIERPVLTVGQVFELPNASAGDRSAIFTSAPTDTSWVPGRERDDACPSGTILLAG